MALGGRGASGTGRAVGAGPGVGAGARRARQAWDRVVTCWGPVNAQPKGLLRHAYEIGRPTEVLAPVALGHIGQAQARVGLHSLTDPGLRGQETPLRPAAAAGQPGGLPGGGMQTPLGRRLWFHRVPSHTHPPSPEHRPGRPPGGPREAGARRLPPEPRLGLLTGWAACVLTPVLSHRPVGPAGLAQPGLDSTARAPAPHPRQPVLSLNRCFSLGCQCRNRPEQAAPTRGPGNRAEAVLP